MSEVESATESTADWARQRQLALIFELQTGSTNDDAKAKAFVERADLALYLADHQTSGKGRGSHTWLDTGAGESLLSTWSFLAQKSLQAITAPRMGLALHQAVRRTWPALAWSLKAPNDLFLDGHKVAGLLIESVTNGNQHRLIVGFGFNILNHPRKFNQATHLSSALGHRPLEADWFRFLDELKIQFTQAGVDATRPELSENDRKLLTEALNANPAKPFVIQTVSPQGDLIHQNGMVRWTDL